MKQERKQELINCFPEIPYSVGEQMKDGKGAANFVVFITRGQELFVRCFHRYSKGKVIAERQRYVFAKDGAVRYGQKWHRVKQKYVWDPMKEIREPVFCNRGYPYSFDNGYTALNCDAVYKSDMRYCQIWEMTCINAWIEYLKFYCRHPNVEYLIKSGYKHLIRDQNMGYYGNRISLDVYSGINWKSNNLLKMLGLNRNEFRILKDNEEHYENYIHWRDQYPSMKPEDILKLVDVFGAEIGTGTYFANITGKSLLRIAGYLKENRVTKWDYRDYLNQCRQLDYDLHDTAICFPYNFTEMHTRLSEIIQYKANEKAQAQLEERYEERKRFEFASGSLVLIQPKSFMEIVNEGKVLHHCVGGYAERHSKGYTNILFIRKESEIDKPYFTIEVSNGYEIIQCHGYKNDINGKPEEISAFEEQYKNYLEVLKNERIKCAV